MMRARCLAVLATLALSTLATSAAVAQQRGCYGVWVTPVRGQTPSAKRVRRARDFSASVTLDLRFLVLVPADGSSALHLKLFTPKGHLYQKLRVSVEPVAAEGNQRKRSRYRWVSASLPVAGTTIVTSSLYGRWRAEAYVEGEDAPCTRPRRFVIRE